MKNSQIFSLISVLILTACSEGGGATAGLDGHWISNCHPLFGYGSSLYGVDEHKYNGDTFETISRNYENSKCSGKPDDVLKEKGTLAIGKLVTTDSGVKANQVDLRYKTPGITIKAKNLLKVEGDKLFMGIEDQFGQYPSDLAEKIVLTRQ